ncbi:SPX domain-containing protein [Cunninghamella echinulata]|nr:SPX domain-containing protein [Cunninghamella echinulata]
MKFAKQLETESENIPFEWRPYLIQYKKLKKIITKVADEIEHYGMSVAMLQDHLNHQEQESPENEFNPDAPQIQYYFTGEAPNVKPCIRFTYDSSNKKVTELLSGFIDTEQQQKQQQNNDKTTDEKENNKEEPDVSTQSSSPPKRFPLEYRHSSNNVDFFALNYKKEEEEKEIVNNKEEEKIDGKEKDKQQHQQKESTLMDEDEDEVNITKRERRNSTAKLIRELTQLTLHKDENNKENGEMKSVVIELEQDDEFFYMLMTELQGSVRLQKDTYDKFETDINELEKRMVKVASPNQKDDMYIWRQIFGHYMDAQIFQGRVETDRTMHSVNKAKQQMSWFASQLHKENLISKLKNSSSKSALRQFMALNTELITMKHYQALNQTAMTKILKKHDKRSGLTASSSFPDFVGMDKYFTPTLAKLICASIMDKLTTIIPQPDDYSCPVCMNIAWRPIRLKCGHFYCVRCLIKAQRKGMNSCPLCRHPTAVKTASALNLDEPLQNFLLMYFPKEIKQKKRDNEREQAIEDIEIMTGRKFTPEQIAKMSKENHNCIIM